VPLAPPPVFIPRVGGIVRAMAEYIALVVALAATVLLALIAYASWTQTASDGDSQPWDSTAVWIVTAIVVAPALAWAIAGVT
jgi:hypothetical protein